MIIECEECGDCGQEPCSPLYRPGSMMAMMVSSTWYVMVVVGSSATGAGGGSAILTATDCCGGWTKTNKTPALPVHSPLSTRGRISRDCQPVRLSHNWELGLVWLACQSGLEVYSCQPWLWYCSEAESLTSSSPVRTSCGPASLPWRALPSSRHWHCCSGPDICTYYQETGDQRTCHDTAWPCRQSSGLTGNLHDRQAAHHWSNSCHRPRALLCSLQPVGQWGGGRMSYPGHVLAMSHHAPHGTPTSRLTNTFFLHFLLMSFSTRGGKLPYSTFQWKVILNLLEQTTGKLESRISTRN